MKSKMISMRILLFFILILALLGYGFSTKSGQRLQGIAAWYSERDPNIRIHTANGEVFDDSKRTCATWDYPFGTYLKITNMANRKSVICRVNDRGPAKRLHRLMDLTKTAFREISNPRAGLIKVSVVPL